MTHNFRTISLFFSARTALLALAVSAVSFAQSTPATTPLEAAAPGTPAANPSAQETPKFVRYLRVGAAGAQARNLADANGVSLGGLSQGTLVAVFKEEGEWLECEVPGGFEIWVFGQYVKVAADAGMLEITGSEVRARPLASSGTESYPLQPNLSKGDRVRLITRKDTSKPLAEDWIKVYSPPGVRAFVAKADCEALPSGTDGAQAWSKAVSESRKRKAATEGLVKTAAPAAAGAAIVGNLSPQQAMEELQKADAALARERRSANPDYAPIRDQYQRVLASTTEGATADMAQRGLTQVNTLIEMLALEAELKAAKNAQASDQAAREEAMRRAREDKDIFAGRFDTRGWLEKRVVPGQAPMYLLRWSGEVICEIQCNSARYDLSAFNGCELGVKGDSLREYVRGDIGRVAVPRLIDAKRIEILSGKAAGR